MNFALEQDFLLAIEQNSWEDARDSVRSAILALNDAIFRILNVLTDEFHDGPRISRSTSREKEPPDGKKIVRNIWGQLNDLQKAKKNGYDMHQTRAKPLNGIARADDDCLEQMVNDVTMLLNATLQRNKPLIDAYLDTEEVQPSGFKPKQKGMEADCDAKPDWNKSTRVRSARSSTPVGESDHNGRKTPRNSRQSASPTSRSPSTSRASTSPALNYASQFAGRNNPHPNAIPNRQSRPILSTADFRRQKKELEQRIRGVRQSSEVHSYLPPSTPNRTGIRSRTLSPSPMRPPNRLPSRSESPAMVSPQRPAPRGPQYDLNGHRIRAPRCTITAWDSDSESMDITRAHQGAREERHPPDHIRSQHVTNALLKHQDQMAETVRVLQVSIAPVMGSPSPQRPQRPAPRHPNSEPMPLGHLGQREESSTDGMIVQSMDPILPEYASSRSSTGDITQPTSMLDEYKALITGLTPAHGTTEAIDDDIMMSSDAVRKKLFMPTPEEKSQVPAELSEDMANHDNPIAAQQAPQEISKKAPPPFTPVAHQLAHDASLLGTGQQDQLDPQFTGSVGCMPERLCAIEGTSRRRVQSVGSTGSIGSPARHQSPRIVLLEEEETEDKSSASSSSATSTEQQPGHLPDMPGDDCPPTGGFANEEPSLPSSSTQTSQSADKPPSGSFSASSSQLLRQPLTPSAFSGVTSAHVERSPAFPGHENGGIGNEDQAATVQWPQPNLAGSSPTRTEIPQRASQLHIEELGFHTLAWKEGTEDSAALNGQQQHQGRQNAYRIGDDPLEHEIKDVKYVSDIMVEINRSLQHTAQLDLSLLRPKASMDNSGGATMPKEDVPSRPPPRPPSPPSLAGSGRPLPPLPISPDELPFSRSKQLLEGYYGNFDEIIVIAEPDRAPHCSWPEEMPKHSPGPHHAAIDLPRPKLCSSSSVRSSAPTGILSDHSTFTGVVSADQPPDMTPGNEWLELTLS